MPALFVSEQTFKRIAERAAALNVSIEEAVVSALDQAVVNGQQSPTPQAPLTGEAWKRELEAWKRDAEGRASRYPPGHVVDDSREAIYAERENAQL